MIKIKKGMLVYIPSGVRLIKTARDNNDYDIYVKEYTVTKKPVNCLVVGESLKGGEGNYRVIYEGGSWFVSPSDVYQINKEKSNASYSS